MVCVKGIPGTLFFLALAKLSCVCFSDWMYVDNYRKEDYVMEQLLKTVNHFFFFPTKMSHHLFCENYINHAANVQFYNKSKKIHMWQVT